MERLAVIILAAGLGKRMGSKEPKVIARAGGRALIEHVLIGAAALGPERVVVVVGHRGEMVEEIVRGACRALPAIDLRFALQREQRGTGDAARAALPELADFNGTILILYGDVPLVRSRSLQELLAVHEREQATVTLLSLHGGTANAYGRIVRDAAGRIERIVELKDCTPEQAAIEETNAGIYAVDSAFLRPALEGLTNDNAQSEYYLTDIIERAAREGQRVASSLQSDIDEFQGVNTRADLASVQRSLTERKITALLERGVRVSDPRTLTIDDTAEVAPGAVLGPCVAVLGETKIGADAVVEGSALIRDSIVGERCMLEYGVVLENMHLADGERVPSFTRRRG